MSLKQEIEAFTAEAVARISAETLAELQKSIDAVRNSGIAERALGVGDRAPDFALPNAKGHEISLADMLQRGPLIISFYRGIWCPYCNLELRAFQRILPDIRAAGGDFVAISPQTPDHSFSTVERNALEFEVLSDRSNQVAAEFGIAYRTPGVVKRIAGSFGADIVAMNGADDDRLPISATYLVDMDSRIALAKVDPDFRLRLEPADALAALRELAAQAACAARISTPTP